MARLSQSEPIGVVPVVLREIHLTTFGTVSNMEFSKTKTVSALLFVSLSSSVFAQLYFPEPGEYVGDKEAAKAAASSVQVCQTPEGNLEAKIREYGMTRRITESEDEPITIRLVLPLSKKTVVSIRQTEPGKFVIHTNLSENKRLAPNDLVTIEEKNEVFNCTSFESPVQKS